MKKILIVLFVLLLTLTSCQLANNTEEPTQNRNEEENTEKELVSSEDSEPIMSIDRPENDYVRFNGELVDLANVTVDESMSSDRAYFETFESLESFIRGLQDGYILKITVTEYPEPTTILHDSGISLPYTAIPCQIESIIYQGENVEIQKGQNINMIGQYLFLEEDGEIYLSLESGSRVLRKGYSYIIYGAYVQTSIEQNKEIYYIDSYDGCFEISSDAEKNTFAENIGLNYPLKSPFQDEVFEKYSNVLTESELAIVKKDNAVVE